MQLMDSDLLLVTGATGLVGSHMAQQAADAGVRVRALVRAGSESALLQQCGVQQARGDLHDPSALQAACQGVSVVVHCAARVGDWGPTADYRRTNVDGTKSLLDAALDSGTLKRWIQISSLGVYSGTDHYGTDETTLPNTQGIDGYTLTKVESELLVSSYIAERQLPAVILRPGFIYGPRDRTVMPRLIHKLRTGKFAYLGKPDKLMNNTFVGNLCEAIWLSIQHDSAVGQVYNIRDARAVSKQEFMNTICSAAGFSIPRKVVPLPVAKFLAWHMETVWKLLRLREAPLVNQARIKFLGRNLDFDIDKAQRELHYNPSHDFTEAMQHTVQWFQAQNTVNNDQ